MFTATANPADPNIYAGNIAYALEKAAILASVTPVPTFLIDLTSFGFTTQPAITQARSTLSTHESLGFACSLPPARHHPGAAKTLTTSPLVYECKGNTECIC